MFYYTEPWRSIWELFILLFHWVYNMLQSIMESVNWSGVRLLSLPENLRSHSVFSGIRVIRSLVLCVCFVDCCLSFFFWPLCCLSFDLRILITPLVYVSTSWCVCLWGGGGRAGVCVIYYGDNFEHDQTFSIGMCIIIN
jgi:hypothetical protein